MFKPSLLSPHTKNCHGVFHQLPIWGGSLRLLPLGTPTKPQTRAHFLSSYVVFISLFVLWTDVCVGLSGGRLKSTGGRGGGVVYCRCPTGLDGGLGWQPAQRSFCFVFFKNLVAWFSYLSQYIFTYLLLKWIPLQLIKKNLVNMLWIYI